MPIDRVSVTARYSAAGKLTFVCGRTGVDQRQTSATEPTGRNRPH